MAHSKGSNKGKKMLPNDSDELRKPAKLKPVKGNKGPKRAKDISAFDEDADDNIEMLSDDDLLFNELSDGDFDDDDDF